MYIRKRNKRIETNKIERRVSYIGITGALLLLVGNLFFPYMVGYYNGVCFEILCESDSEFLINSAAGVILLICIIIFLTLVIMKKPKISLIPTLISTGIVIYVWFNQIPGVKWSLYSYETSYGYYIMLIGVTLCITYVLTSIFKNKAKSILNKGNKK